MILGNPYDFAVILDVVDKWNKADSYSFYNGILAFYIDGEIFPNKMVNATLGSEVPNLVKQFSQVPVNEKLFDMSKEDAFLKIHQITFPEDIDVDNDYSYEITPNCFGDINCCVFAVSNGQQVRVLASGLEYSLEEGRHELDNIEIMEAIVSADDMAEVISKLKTWNTQLIKMNMSYIDKA